MNIGRYFYAGAYATAWEVQIGPLWFGILYPRMWLYYAKRRGRKWFFNWPAFVKWDKDWNAE